MGKRGPKPGNHQNVERNAEIARRVASGETLKAVGDSYGLTRERVRQLANLAGVTERSAAFKRNKRVEILTKLAEEGLPRKEMAERTGYSYYVVSETIRRFGITAPGLVLKKDTHGTIQCYRNGCKCDMCKKANSDQHKKWEQSKSEDRIPHGTLSGYTNWKCRCPDCKLQGSIANKKARERRKRTPPPKHGLNGYINYGCKCAVCSSENRQYRKALKERKAQREAS